MSIDSNCGRAIVGDNSFELLAISTFGEFIEFKVFSRINFIIIDIVFTSLGFGDVRVVSLFMNTIIFHKLKRLVVPTSSAPLIFGIAVN
jgi:hypothetical protein